MGSTLDYIRSHWRGDQSLLRAFWINLVAIRLLVLFFEQFTHPPFIDRSIVAIAATLTYLILFQVIVFGWQAVGLIRACDRFQSARGAYVTVLAVQLGLVISLLVTVIYVAGAFQALFADPSAMVINQRVKKAPLVGTYSVTLNDDKTRVHVTGDFGIGVTFALTSLLDQNPGVTGVVFSSNGGRVAEGRGLARVIGRHKLDTFVFDVCKSACATAFIGGVTRTLGPDGKLGFHQLSLKSENKTPYINPQEEQKIDLAFYTQQKIAKEFRDKVFQVSPNEIWFPDPQELLSAGVIHKIEADKIHP